MFQQAARLKLRFKTSKGLVTVEDLFDFPLTALDALAKTLRKRVQDNNLESFIAPHQKKDKVLELQFEIVKHIITTRLAEVEAAENAELKRQKRAKIISLIEDKKDDALKESSLEELTALLNNL